MKPTARILLVAVAAGVLGLLASLSTSGPGFLLGSDLGQRWLGAVLSTRTPAPSGMAVAARGQVVAPFALHDLHGARVAVPAAFAGRPLLINVWASWCGPCIEELPALAAYARQQGPNGVQVVGIALDDPAAVRAFLRRIPVSYPVLVEAPGPADAGVRLGNPAGVLPYSVLLSPAGVLLKQRIGPFAPGEIPRWVEH